MSEEDIYIKALRFANKKKRFTLTQLLDHLELKDNEREELKMTLRYQVRQGELFSSQPGDFEFIHSTWEAKSKPDEAELNNEPKLDFSVSDKFRLIEYDELREARTASKNATYWAAGALAISTIALTINIYFSVSGANSSKEISETSRKTSIAIAKDLRHDLNVIKVEIENLRQQPQPNINLAQ